MRYFIPILLLSLASTPVFAEETTRPRSGQPAIAEQANSSNKEPSSDQPSEADTVYKWKDSEGKIHYGDEPPEDIEAERVPMNAQKISVKKAEQVYTWTDSEGNVHYGDRPPEDSQAEQVDMESGSMSTIRDTVVRPGERQLLREIER